MMNREQSVHDYNLLIQFHRRENEVHVGYCGIIGVGIMHRYILQGVSSRSVG